MLNWHQLLTDHGPRVWRTVYRLLNHHADAHDCYQETFLAAFRMSEREQVANWPALLTSLATRKAMDRLRQRYRSRPFSCDLDRAPEPVSERGAPAAAIKAEELKERLRWAMTDLPEKQAEVFWLSCLEGLDHAHIADRMNIPKGEVRVLLHRARASLAKALGPSILNESPKGTKT